MFSRRLELDDLAIIEDAPLYLVGALSAEHPVMLPPGDAHAAAGSVLNIEVDEPVPIIEFRRNFAEKHRRTTIFTRHTNPRPSYPEQAGKPRDISCPVNSLTMPFVELAGAVTYGARAS